MGVTNVTIKVGVLSPLTGPAAPVGKMISEGSKIAFRAANDAGGVSGRKFDLILEDNSMSAGAFTLDKLLELSQQLGRIKPNGIDSFLDCQRKE